MLLKLNVNFWSDHEDVTLHSFNVAQMLLLIDVDEVQDDPFVEIEYNSHENNVISDDLTDNQVLDVAYHVLQPDEAEEIIVEIE